MANIGKKQDIANVTWKKSSNRMVSRCPLHLDNRPSLTLYPKTQTAYCFQCDTVWFLESDFVNKIEYVPLGESNEENEPIPVDMAKYWHRNLLQSGKYQYFKDRGFAMGTIQKELWGWHDVFQRYVVTVWRDEPQKSDLVQVHFRASKKDQHPKYFGLEHHNHPELYGSYLLRTAKRCGVFIGELDARLATQHGLPGVSGTGGKGVFRLDWSKYFGNVEEILIVPDLHEEDSAAKIAEMLGPRRCKIVHLPVQYKDFTEFIVGGNTMDDFWSLVSPLNIATPKFDAYWERTLCG